MDNKQRKETFLALRGVFKSIIVVAMNVVTDIISAPSEREFVLNANGRVLNVGIKFRQFLETNIAPFGELLTECIDIQKKY